jgi:glycosidase
MVPVEFWDNARAALDNIKPVFMLAEAEDAPLIVSAFDMEYGWEFHHIMNHVAKGDLDADSIQAYFDRQMKRYPRGAYKMNFTSNHDENSWNGTVWERMGDGAYAFAVLSSTVPGMPLVYTGQEAGLDKRLEFFEKDQVEWKEHPFFDLYKALFELKHENKALWNGEFGGSFIRLESSDQSNIYAFVREKEDDKVVAIFNFSDQEGEYEISGKYLSGEYTVFMSDETVSLSDKETMTLKPWEYRVYYK